MRAGNAERIFRLLQRSNDMLAQAITGFSGYARTPSAICKERNLRQAHSTFNVFKSQMAMEL
jgi:hypothetical protein